MVSRAIACSAKSFSPAATARSDAHSSGAAMCRAQIPVFFWISLLVLLAAIVVGSLSGYGIGIGERVNAEAFGRDPAREKRGANQQQNRGCRADPHVP